MTHPSYPITAAIRYLRDKNVPFTPYLYSYEEHGGTAHAAEELNLPEHQIIKTLVMETESRKPLIVLMHGDREVSIKQLARTLDVKRVTPCEPSIAQKHTGYLVGGTSPFGTRAPMPVYVESSVMKLPALYINGGKRGFLVGITPDDLRSALTVQEVNVAIAGG